MSGEAWLAKRGDDLGAAAEMRASHQDRDQVVELLRVAAGDGRLTAEELDQRLEVALTARTHGQLAALLTDLPEGPGFGPAGPAGPAAEPKDMVRFDCRSGQVKRDGPWLVPRRVEVRVTSGRVRLDFTEAVITGAGLQVDAEVSSGELRLVTRPGIVVDADDVVIRSGEVKVRAPWDPGTPVLLRVTVSGSVGSG